MGIELKPTRYFRTIFLEEVNLFFKGIDRAAVKKILFNIAVAEQTNDPRLFKKLTDHVWEFRARYCNMQYRLLAFWDKTDSGNTLVVATHGIIKKTDTVPVREIERAVNMRRAYFSDHGE